MKGLQLCRVQGGDGYRGEYYLFFSCPTDIQTEMQIMLNADTRLRWYAGWIWVTSDMGALIEYTLRYYEYRFTHG